MHLLTLWQSVSEVTVYMFILVVAGGTVSA